MDKLQLLTRTGGVFAALVFWHFFADFVLQSHSEATKMTKDRLVRARLCLKYALVFVPLFWWISLRDGVFEWSMAILFVSHYIIDSYVPLLLWAKYVYKAPQFKLVNKNKDPLPRTGWSDHVVESQRYCTDKDAFKAFASTPLGFALTITIDQVLHIAFLLPVAYMAANR